VSSGVGGVIWFTGLTKSVKLQSIEVGLKPGADLYDWQYLVHGCTALSPTDRTLNVLLDHLRDLDLATILTRLADRSEP